MNEESFSGGKSAQLSWYPLKVCQIRIRCDQFIYTSKACHNRDGYGRHGVESYFHPKNIINDSFTDRQLNSPNGSKGLFDGMAGVPFTYGFRGEPQVPFVTWSVSEWTSKYRHCGAYDQMSSIVRGARSFEVRRVNRDDTLSIQHRGLGTRDFSDRLQNWA